MSSSSSDGAYVPYSSRPEWSDVTGVAQAEPAGAPVVRIDYAPEYEDAADTFRAVLASGEASARVLALTEAIIAMNGAHYTVWHHRFRVLTELLSSPANANANDDQDDPPAWSLRDELRYVDRMAEKNPKNYQVWNHARLVSAALCANEDDRAGCLELNLTLTRRALDADAKNIHAWTHRLWCARAFDLWRAEPAFCDEMLQRDVRNNSAWSHRFVAALGEGGDDKADAAEIARREMGYAETKLRLAPDNESAWNYLRACAAKGGWGALGGECERVASEHAREGGPGRRHALALLAEARARRGDRRSAADAFEALETSADPIRARYWRWKREALR
jgi:protein farnesyltransferase/geranylgeranyltransferase type-1 subunit alpha